MSTATVRNRAGLPQGAEINRDAQGSGKMGGMGGRGLRIADCELRIEGRPGRAPAYCFRARRGSGGRLPDALRSAECGAVDAVTAGTRLRSGKPELRRAAPPERGRRRAGTKRLQEPWGDFVSPWKYRGCREKVPDTFFVSELHDAPFMAHVAHNTRSSFCNSLFYKRLWNTWVASPMAPNGPESSIRPWRGFKQEMNVVHIARLPTTHAVGYYLAPFQGCHEVRPRKSPPRRAGYGRATRLRERPRN